MNCRELREYLIAFLDNELDAALSLSAQRHLEQCPECAREAEIERAIRRQLTQALIEDSHVGAEGRAGGELGRFAAQLAANPFSTRSPARRVRRRRGALAAAAVLAVGAAGGTWWIVGRSHHVPNPFVDRLIADFEDFQAQGQPLQIASSDPFEVSNWLVNQTALTVTLPEAKEKGVKLLGARKCQIAGQPAALAAYEIGGSLATLVVVPGAPSDVDNMARVEHDGHTHWVDRCKGHTVLACQRGPLVYAAVSKLPENRLRALMSNPNR